MCNTHSPLIHSDFVAYALEPRTAFGQGTFAWTSHTILWICFLLSYFIIIWIKTGAISSFFHSDSSHQMIYKMKAFHKDKCHQAIVCAGLWVTPSSLSHSPPMWFGSSSDPISSVVVKRKEEMGHCTMTKGQSLNIQQLRKVWAPVVSNAQRKLVLAVCGCQGRQTDKAAQTPPAVHRGHV